MDDQLIGIAVGLGALGLLLFLTFIKTNIVICQPNEIVILTGRKRRASDGSAVGFRVLRGGRNPAKARLSASGADDDTRLAPTGLSTATGSIGTGWAPMLERLVLSGRAEPENHNFPGRRSPGFQCRCGSVLFPAIPRC